MKLTEFMTKIQDYYGVNNRAKLRELAKYLYNANESYLDALYEICLCQYSSKWKNLMDIAMLEEMKQDGILESQRKLSKRDSN